MLLSSLKALYTITLSYLPVDSPSSILRGGCLVCMFLYCLSYTTSSPHEFKLLRAESFSDLLLHPSVSTAPCTQYVTKIYQRGKVS